MGGVACTPLQGVSVSVLLQGGVEPPSVLELGKLSQEILAGPAGSWLSHFAGAE